MRIRTIAASLAIGASALGAAGLAAASASAATVAPATTMAAHMPSVAPLFGTWHKMTVTLNGTTYNGYWVYMVLHHDGLLTGWLYDGDPTIPPVFPATSRSNGDYANGVVQVLNAKYLAGDPQGDRAFLAIAGPGHLTGIWNETGTEDGSGAFAFVS